MRFFSYLAVHVRTIRISNDGSPLNTVFNTKANTGIPDVLSLSLIVLAFGYIQSIPSNTDFYIVLIEQMSRIF